MSLLQLILISIVQGITEWLPISSSAHVLLLSDSFGVTGRDELLINAVSNLGTLAAMLVYFRKDVASAVAGGVELLGAPVRKTPLSPGARLAACVIVATPLALIVALLYEAALPEAIQATLRSVPVVAGATIVFGLLGSTFIVLVLVPILLVVQADITAIFARLKLFFTGQQETSGL